MLIRDETGADRAAVHALNSAAFPSAAEADLVDALRELAKPSIALVAEADDRIVGHILFTPVTLSANTGLSIMGVAPMAVLPEFQRRGIGSALVAAGLSRCRDLGAGAVVVLGHPDYYPRFDFKPASDFDIDCEYDVPPGVFMLQELVPGYLQGHAGTIRYHAAFADA